jgi:hypothetical protein
MQAWGDKKKFQKHLTMIQPETPLDEQKDSNELAQDIAKPELKNQVKPS